MKFGEGFALLHSVRLAEAKLLKISKQYWFRLLSSSNCVVYECYGKLFLSPH